MASNELYETDLLAALDADAIARDPKEIEAIRRREMVGDLIVIRRNLKLSQAAVAARMGVGRDVVNRIENAPFRVSMDKIFAYAVAMGVRILLQAPEAA